MFTDIVGPVEVFFYWPEAVLGNFYWPGAIRPLLASSPALQIVLNFIIVPWAQHARTGAHCNGDHDDGGLQ